MRLRLSSPSSSSASHLFEIEKDETDFEVIMVGRSDERREEPGLIQKRSWRLRYRKWGDTLPWWLSFSP